MRRGTGKWPPAYEVLDFKSATVQTFNNSITFTPSPKFPFTFSKYTDDSFNQHCRACHLGQILTMSSSSISVPAQPAYIFRGHTAQIHSLKFWRSNARLISGDAEGWVVVWDMMTRRARVVWKAHKSSVLAIEPWGDEKLITYDSLPLEVS
jgi:WD40 repeat protein